jgi:hypothetical protein
MVQNMQLRNFLSSVWRRNRLWNVLKISDDLIIQFCQEDHNLGLSMPLEDWHNNNVDILWSARGVVFCGFRGNGILQICFLTPMSDD